MTDDPSRAERRPLVYACSGCSSAAQTANDVALALDRRGEAEMSCIAGVGGDVALLVRVAKSGRDIVVLDGCPLQCAKHCLARHGVQFVQRAMNRVQRWSSTTLWYARGRRLPGDCVELVVQYVHEPAAGKHDGEIGRAPNL